MRALVGAMSIAVGPGFFALAFAWGKALRGGPQNAAVRYVLLTVFVVFGAALYITGRGCQLLCVRAGQGPFERSMYVRDGHQ
jgi:hypothetical protein